jgi:opacity protein-like surface antigen
MFLKSSKLKSLAFISMLLFPLASWAVPGAYVSGEVGGVLVNSTTIFENDSSTGFGGRAALGYLWGDNNFNYGLESGILVYPHAEADSTVFLNGVPFLNSTLVYDGYNIDLLGVVKYTFDNGFALFAKGGGAYVYQKATATVQTPLGQTSDSATQSKVAPEVAGGIGYQFNPNFEADLTTSVVFAGSPSDTNSNDIVCGTASAMLGLTYHFG